MSEEKELIQIIKSIKANEDAVIKELYSAHYQKIESYILKNSGTKMHAKDIYQEAFVSFWKNICSDKFIPENKSSLGGYIYRIARNKWIDYLRTPEFRKMTRLNEDRIMTTMVSEFEKNQELQDNRAKKLAKHFDELGSACQILLTDFYYHKKSMRLIANSLGITEASARNKKYRCLQKLRSIVLNEK